MRSLLALLVAAALTLTGCAMPGSEQEETGATHTGGSASLSFEGTALDGKTFDGESLAGRPAVLWFWAPWCPTCRAQIPNVTALAKKYDGEVAVIGVGGLDDEAEIRRTADKIPHVTHLVDDEGAVWKHFGVSAQSTYVVFDADGRKVADGYVDDADLNDLVADLAAEG